MHPAGGAGIGINVRVVTFHKYIFNSIFYVRMICPCGEEHVIGIFCIGVKDSPEKGCHQVLLGQELEKCPFKGVLPDHKGDGDGVIIEGNIVPGAWGDNAYIPGRKASFLIFKDHVAGAGKNIVDFKEIVGMHTFSNIPYINNGKNLQIFRHDGLGENSFSRLFRNCKMGLKEKRHNRKLCKHLKKRRVIHLAPCYFTGNMRNIV